jgi:hypothetical protein
MSRIVPPLPELPEVPPPPLPSAISQPTTLVKNQKLEVSGFITIERQLSNYDPITHTGYITFRLTKGGLEDNQFVRFNIDNRIVTSIQINVPSQSGRLVYTKMEGRVEGQQTFSQFMGAIMNRSQEGDFQYVFYGPKSGGRRKTRRRKSRRARA